MYNLLEKYMSRPCNIVDDEKLWYIYGSSVNHGSGVLAWCYDEEDSKQVLSEFKEHEEFSNLGFEKFR